MTPARQVSDGAAVPFRLEVVVIPVDVDRAKSSFANLGWRLDADLPGDDGYRVPQLTPPGSNASIIFGSGITSAQPGSFAGLVLAVDDIDAAHNERLSHGVEVTGGARGSVGWSGPSLTSEIEWGMAPWRS